MKIEKKKVSGEVERKVVIGAIMSSAVCKLLEKSYEKGFISSKAVSYILEICIDYYATHGDAPAAVIQDIFEVDIDRGTIDEDTESLAASLLESCSAQFEHEESFNHDYYLDLARGYISGQSLTKLSNDLKANVDRGRIEEAETIVDSYQGIATHTIDIHNPFTDPDLMQRSFEQASEPLLRMRGAYGEMINELMVREGFIAVMGPEKRGKTWQLIEFAVAGLKARLNVALFSLGDMSETQLSLRIAIRLAGLSNRMKYCKEHWEPVLDCKFNQDDSCNRSCRSCDIGLGIDEEEFGAGEFNPWDAPKRYKPCIACSDLKATFWYEKIEARAPLEWRDAYKILNKFYTQWVKGNKFRMCCVPNGSLSITGMHNKLNAWSKGEDPFVADLLISDYMDIAAPEPQSFSDFRHSENEKWKAARRLSQHWHLLHISATQADAASYNADTISEDNFSEDKRKYGHVTGILGLNQTRMEKQLGLMRINTMFLREEAFHADHTCTQLQNLARGRAHLDSFWG